MQIIGRPFKNNLIRNYKCGCGKMYVSCTNLYYHYDKVHNGKPPENSYVKKKKGR